MTTEEIHTLTGAYALDAVTDAERAAFHAHLGDCPTCAQEVLELRETAARLGAAVAVIPGDALRDRVLAAVAVTRQQPPSVADAVVLPLRSRRWTRRVAIGVSSLAAAAAVLVGGISIGLDHPAEPGQAVSSVSAAPDAASVTATGVSGGSVTAVVSRRQGKVAVTAGGLPALDSAHSYEVWLAGPRGSQSAGLLHSGDHARPVVAEIPADVDHIAVTVEPVAGSPQPTTPGVVRIDLN
ncbi:anti-sigma factor [Amycolatopsis sp. H20-H5]|uniref:anti-sigma factor n=1 Tax=Amycolatopsis sp. H20-H5 TaxID=3046309 RepID=UPI002DB630DA|nr:anti-sigma factor [Amycolatopsis sp. H20-H5]MEC3980383.1 anti-sigma factor [Amycolatopsis sp. H20-H5]